MRKLFILSILFSPILLIAQQNQATLKVQGVSELSVKPSISKITYHVSSIKIDYIKAIEELANRVKLVTDALNDIGIQNESILTSSFQVSVNRRYSRGGEIDSGYIASQTLTIEFENNADRLLQILNNTAKSNANPNISISFSISNEQKIKIQNQLIQLAVKDGIEKAKLIAEAANYKLNGIKEIEYGLNNARNSSDMLFSISEEGSEQIEPELSSFHAKNLTFNNQVLIIFYIIK